jgi:Winged helix-turn-helix DNA-binding
LSVLDEVRGLEQRVAARLAELHPLVEEYHQLEQLAKRLGIDVELPDRRRQQSRTRARRASGTRQATGARSARRKTSASSRRAPRGTKAVGAHRRARVLELIEARPGIAVPDIARELAVDPPPLYRVVRKLQAEGRVKKDGKGLWLV